MGAVITYGTFDLFHIGHLKLLERISKIGSPVIVAVSTDEFNAGKGKKSIIPFEDRKAIVSSIKYVDIVIPEETWEQKRHDVLKYKVDNFVIGDDWRGKFDDLLDICNVHYLSRTDGVSSTEIKSALSLFSKDKINDLMSAIKAVSDIAKALG